MSAITQKSIIATNPVTGSICKIDIQAVTFEKLWGAYPSGHPYVDTKTGHAPLGYENQCAIRVSAAIHGSGVEMKSFKGVSISLDGKKAAVVATQLASWLDMQPFCGLPRKSISITGKDWQSKIISKTGIIYFENYWKRPGETKAASGDHIDLWNGSALTPNAPNILRRLGVEGIQWLPGPLSDYNFSDLANSTKILFWEIK
jgi:Type VI secretion system (T6SS), amidase effector protein 4